MSQSPVAPIAYFVYNRPDHVKRSLEALRKNYLAPQSKLFIFSDGPANEKAVQGVQEVREYLKDKSHTDGFASVEIIERETNHGCGVNIVEGITQVANEFGRLVIVEDDILTSPYFLTYINDG
ncbi:MAG: glycosyltransferase, partial [Synergistaceae bacterium]|nr:glycosyltransferase [Synergistaceae bacterium]